MSAIALFSQPLPHHLADMCLCMLACCSHTLTCAVDKIAECNCACVGLCCAGLNEVVLRFHKAKIIRIRPNGDFMLTSGGWLTATTGQSCQEHPRSSVALNCLSDRGHRCLPVSVTDVYQAIAESQWQAWLLLVVISWVHQSVQTCCGCSPPAQPACARGLHDAAL